jgi:pimeloyl-ACP methyl ester carboxylesterase
MKKSAVLTIALIISALMIAACTTPVQPPSPEPSPAVDPSPIPSPLPTESTEEAPVVMGDEQTAEDDDLSVIGISDKAAGTITSIECPIHPEGDEKEGETYSCGTYTVPLNYDDPESDTLDMTYMLMKSTGDSPQSDPLVQLAGGPGQSDVIVGGQGLGYEQVREERDLVYASVRGTKFSQRFDIEQCFGTAIAQGKTEDELTALIGSLVPADDGSEKPEMSFEEALAEQEAASSVVNSLCQEVFNTAGLDVKQFTTANTARDIVGLIDALGYDTYNLHGISYGTNLALVIMRDHPDSGLRSVVLDSSAAPNFEHLKRDVRARHDGVQQLFADCAADAACAGAYPDLEQRFVALLAAFEAKPLEVGDKIVSADDLAAVIGDLSATRPNYMPLMIAELEQGVTDTFVGLQSHRLGTASPVAAEGGADPALQALMTRMMNVYGEQGDESTDVMGFMGEMATAASQADPRAALTQLVQDNFEGAVQRDILAQLNDIEDQTFSTLIAAVESGNADEEPAMDDDEMMKRLLVSAQKDAYLLMHIINCREFVPFQSLDDALAEYGRLEIPQLGGARSEIISQVGNCAGWELADVDPIDNEAVISDIPTLILQGEFDLRTPIGSGQLAAEGLENSTLAIVPLQGHGIWAIENPCVGRIATAFIADPSQTPDLSCLEERKAKFVLPDAE